MLAFLCFLIYSKDYNLGEFGFLSNKLLCAHTHLINSESNEWDMTYAKNLDEENKLNEACFQYVHYNDKYDIAIYRKRK